MDRPRPATGAERLQSRSGPRGREDRLAFGASPRRARTRPLVPPAGLLRCLARVRRAGGRSLERLVLDAPRRRYRRMVSGGMRRLRHRPGAACRRPPGARGAGTGGSLAEGRGGPRPVDASSAGLWRRHGGDAGGRSGRAGRGLRRNGDGRARVRGRARAGARPGRRHRAPPPRRARRLAPRELRVGSRAARTAGSATSSGRWRQPGPRPSAPTSTSS